MLILTNFAFVFVVFDMDERAVLCELKKGDKSAFEFLYKRYWAKVFNFTKLYVSLNAEAEEIVHVVFIKLWENRVCVDEDKNFQGFLFIVTRNTIFNRSRRSFNDSFYDLTVVEVAEESYCIEEELEVSNLKEYINTLVSQLSPRCQEVFRLSREQGLSYKEIAGQLGLSERTVEHHISDALKFLKKRIPLYLFFI